MVTLTTVILVEPVLCTSTHAWSITHHTSHTPTLSIITLPHIGVYDNTHECPHSLINTYKNYVQYRYRYACMHTLIHINVDSHSLT